MKGGRDEQKQYHIGRKRQHLCTQHNNTHNHNYHTTHYTPTPTTYIYIYITERLHFAIGTHSTGLYRLLATRIWYER